MNEEAQAQYIRALLSRQKNSLFKGGSLLNPAVPQSTDLGLLASLDTSFQGVQPEAKPQQEKQASGFDQFMNNVLGFVDEIAAKFGAGFVGGWEGGFDLLATGAGALGWEDAAKWAEQDIGTQASEWAKTSFGLGAWYNRLRNGKWDAQEWEDIGKGFLDINQAAFFAKNDLGNMRENLSDKYYGGNDEVLSQMNLGGFKAGEFMGGIAHSIGFMLPSIMTANAAGAASGAAVGSKAYVAASKAGSLATLGLGAAGKGAEEALNEGASAGQALGYGAASGAIEVASEMAVGPILAKIGIGTGRVAGVVGKESTGKALAKSARTELVKDIAKSAFEEGAEEVFSALFEPITKSIYKGSSALKEYGSSEFWVGGNDSVLGQFASGAVTGGIMSGVHETSLYKKVGPEGYKFTKAYANAMEKATEAIELERSGKTEQYKKAVEEFGKAYLDMTDEYKKLEGKASDKQMQEIARLLENPESFQKAIERDTRENTNESIKKFVDDMVKEGSDFSRVKVRKAFNELQRVAGTDVELRFDEGKSRYLPHSNIIYLNNSALETKGGIDLVHEYLGHAMSRVASNKVQDALYNKITDTTDVGHQIVEDIKKSDIYKNLKEGSRDFKEEVIAHFLGETFEAETIEQNLSQQLGSLNQLVGNKTLFDHILNIFSGIKGFKASDPIFREYAKTINNFLKATSSNAKSRRIVAIAKKLMKNEKLSEGERKFYKKYRNIIDAIVDLETQTSTELTKYSKEESIVLGNYTVGDNKKKMTVRRSSKGGYEIYFPSEERTITEAEIGGEWVKNEKGVEERVGGETVKFNTIQNVRKYLEDIGAEKVKHEVNLDPRSIMETVEAKSESEADHKEAETKARELLKQYREKDTKNRYRIVEDGNKLHIVRTIRALDNTVDLSNVDTEGREAKAKEELAKKHKPLDVKKPVYVEEGGKVYRMSIKQVSERLYNVEYLDKNGKLVSKKELTRKELKKLKAGDAAEKVVDTVKIRAGLDSEVRKSKARATEIVNELKSKDKVSDYEIRQNERSFDIVRKPKITYESNDVYDVKYRGRTFQKTRNELKEYLIGFGSRVSNTKADVKPNYSSYFVSNSKNKYTEFKYRRINDNEFEILENKDGNGQLVSKKLSADEFKREIKSYKYSAETLEQLQERQKGKKVENEKPKTKRSKELNKANNVAREFAKTAKFESIESLRKATGSKVTAPKNAETVAKEIKAEAKKPLDVDKVLTKEKKRISRIAYKSLATTEDILNQSFKAIQDMIGKDYKVVAPINMQDFTSRTYSDINQVKNAESEAKRLVNKLMETTIETSNREYIGTLEEMLDDNQIESLKNICKDIIESAPNSKARSIATRKLEIQLEKAQAEARDYKSGQARARVLVRAIDRARNTANYYQDITGIDLHKNGLNTLLELLKRIHGASNSAFSAKGYRDNIANVLEWYNEETIAEQYEGLIYNPAIRAKLEEIYDGLGRAKGNVTKFLTTDAMQKTIEVARMINADIKQMMKHYTDAIAPASQQTIAAINRSGYGQKSNVLARLFRSYKRGFAPAYAVIEEVLGGNSEAARVLITDMQLAVNSKQLYTGEYHDKINKKLKELGIKKTFDTKKVSIRGHEISIDQAMGLYISAKVQANFDAMNEDGVVVYDEKNKRFVDLAGVGEAETLKKEINNVIPSNYKQFADWLLNTMNSSVKAEYMKWYEQKFGKYQARNEIGNLGDTSYWTLNRSYQKIDNLSKKVSNPAALFTNSIRRTKGGGNAVMITGALGTFDAYIDKLGRELYVKPTYEDALAILNSKGADGKSVMDTLTRRVDYGNDIKYLKDTLADMLGANRRQTTLLDKMVSAFSVAKLSLNIGSMMKQFASAFTSNIPISKTAKALIERWSPEARAEFKKLSDELGGLKYREASQGVLRANADSVGQITEKIAKVGMIGISKVDMFTVSTGVYSLMVIGQDQFGYQIGSQKNIDFVKSHWTEYELSQIGNSALSKNAIARGESLTRYLFGFLQGANRAALGSQIHKYGLWQRNKNVDIKELNKELKSAKEALKEAKARYEIDSDDLEARKAYISAESRVLDLQNQIADYEAFKVAGGKVIPANMATGIVAQGILIALVNALMKRIKGKKDWDELDIAEEGLALAMAIGVDWVPLVNFISNMVQGYDVDIPATNLLNQFVAIFKSGASQDWSKMIKQMAWLAGDMTGIPFQTIYDYIYGTLKLFDPEVAYEMRSVFYGSSLQSAMNTMKSYAQKGKQGKTAGMVDVIMKQYKTGSTNDEINEELASLYISGYNALPKSAMTQYTDDNGDVVKLTAQQITQFQQEYSKATDDVAKLVRLTEYRSLTAEEKAKAIKKLYDAYYNIAKAKVMGVKPSSKMEQVIALTNGNVDMARYVIYLQKVGQITDTNKKSRKELVLDYINKLKGFTKAEKALLMYLAGYSVSGNSASALSNLLIRNGANRKEVKELIG